MGDFINIQLPDGTTKGTYVFNYEFDYNGGYMGMLETPTITRTQETYPTTSVSDQIKTMGVNVDRANKEIDILVQDVDDVTAELSLKVDKDDNDQVVSMLNASANVITLNSNRLIINSSYFTLNAQGYMTATGGTIGGFTLGANTFSANLTCPYTYTQADATRVQDIVWGNITPTSEDFEKYDIDRNDVINLFDLREIVKYINGTLDFSGQFVLDTTNSLQAIQIQNENNEIVGNMGVFGSYFERLTGDYAYIREYLNLVSDDTGSYGITLGKQTYSDNGIEYNTNELRLVDTDGNGGQIVLSSHEPMISLIDSNALEKVYINGETGEIRLDLTINDVGIWKKVNMPGYTLYFINSSITSQSYNANATGAHFIGLPVTFDSTKMVFSGCGSGIDINIRVDCDISTENQNARINWHNASSSAVTTSIRYYLSLMVFP